jgi:hypothetical protein
VTFTPTGSVQVSTSSTSVYWSLYTCDPTGCTYTSGYSTYSETTSSAPVNIRFQSYHGTGTLSWSTSVCTADCPPAGAYYSVPSSSNLYGNVVSSQDAGSLNMSGPPPTIN